MISLQSFKVLKKLSVRNIHVERKKVKATYSVERFSGEATSFELIYSYEHDYFNKNNPADLNLASMMLAQVAGGICALLAAFLAAVAPRAFCAKALCGKPRRAKQRTNELRERVFMNDPVA